MKAFWIAGLLTGVASSAFAADLPSTNAPPAPPPVYAPIFTWTGFYVGLNGGYAYRSMSSSNFTNSSGGVIGGQAGYNYQIGQFVGGIEGDIDWTDTADSGTFINGTNKFTTGAMITERLRAGIAMDRSLLFITGGYAGIQTRGSIIDPINGIAGGQDAWRNGGVIGAGVEYALTNNVSAKAEYLYAPFSSHTYFGGTPDAENNGLSLSLLRVGLNYKF
jgi:outer membrane immunogenic protein